MQSTTDLFERIRFGGQPAANLAGVVISGRARFTILAPRLLRLEWSDNGQFEDRGTFAFPTRFSAAPPQFTTRQEGRTLVIDTGALVLRYLQDSGKFLPHNLSITFPLNGKSVAWTPGTPGLANLRGTAARWTAARATRPSRKVSSPAPAGPCSTTAARWFSTRRMVGWRAPRTRPAGLVFFRLRP